MSTYFPPQQALPRKDNHSTLLVVDDQPGPREVLKGLLAGQDYRLAFASSGEEALTKAAELAPDLVILDVMMPGMDGFTVCRSLRANPLSADVPIIMVTALDDRQSRLQGFQAGADDFITKPFDPVELLARVQTITQLNRYRRLHAERARFEWVVENSDDGYVIITETDALLFANVQARRYLGLPFESDTPVCKTFLELARAQYTCQPQDAWQDWPGRSENGLPMYLIRPASTTDNSFWLQVDRMEISSNFDGYLLRLHDITAQVTVKQQMWTFHAQVSHKLRTPITLVTGFLDFLLGETSLCSGEQQKLLSSIYRNALRLQNEIQDVLQYLETPKLARPGSELCSIADVLVIVDSVKAELGVKQVTELSSNIITPESMFLPLSPQAIELVLRELLENAKKFHPVQLPTIEVIISEVEDGIRIQVADDGLTLSLDQLTKIWIPYYQAEKYFTGQVAGIGLGLSMVASLVWEVGGVCRSYNRPDRSGLIIELVLPLARKNHE